MDSSEDVERLSRAIEKLLDEKRRRDAAGDAFYEDGDNQLLLSRLLSQLELQKETENLKKLEGPTKEESIKAEDKIESPGQSENQKEELSTEDMAKEIKDLKRQNTITHVLLSAMIVLTLTWQLSEFSVILRLKDRLSHPFKSFGGKLVGMLKGGVSQSNGRFPEKHRESSREQNHHDETPSLKVPELLRELGFNGEE